MWGHWRFAGGLAESLKDRFCGQRQVLGSIALVWSSPHRCRGPAAQVYTMLTGELCDESKPYFVAFRSEFVVSRARLRAQPLATYQKLHSYVGVRPRPKPPTDSCSSAHHSRPGCSSVCGHGNKAGLRHTPHGRSCSAL